MELKKIIRNIIDRTPFKPVHIGFYTRRMYFRNHLKKLPLQHFKHTLDAGCSTGHYAIEVAQKYPHLHVDAVDLDGARFPQNHPPNITFSQQDLLKPENTPHRQNHYHLIYSIDVLEHIPGNQQVIQNLCRALAPGGYLFLHIPNDKTSKHILPRRFFKEFDQWAGEEHIGEEYTPAQLADLVETFGLTTVNASYSFGFLGQLAWEIDRLSDRAFKLKILLMPFLKTLAWIAVHTPHRRGCTMLLARKKDETNKTK